MTGSTANVVDRGLGLHRKKDCRSEVFEFSVSSADRFNLLDLPIDSLSSGIGLFMTKGITHALEESFEGLGYLQDIFYGRRFHTGKPEFKVLLCFVE